MLGTGAFFVYRALRGLPLRQILMLVAKMKNQAPEQIETALKSGEGDRIVLASLRDLKVELAALVDVQAKQNAMKAVGKADVQARLLAFEELAVASLTRSITAVYVVSIAQLLIHTQIFELMRLQRLGRIQHEEAQRRFLSIIQHFHLQDERGACLFVFM